MRALDSYAAKAACQVDGILCIRQDGQRHARARRDRLTRNQLLSRKGKTTHEKRRWREPQSSTPTCAAPMTAKKPTVPTAAKSKERLTGELDEVVKALAKLINARQRENTHAPTCATYRAVA